MKSPDRATFIARFKVGTCPRQVTLGISIA